MVQLTVFSALVALATAAPVDPLDLSQLAPKFFSLAQVAVNRTIPLTGAKARQNALAKYNFAVPQDVAAAAKQQGSVTNNPESYDESYLCPVKIGSNSQTLMLDFDTGSADLWAFSTEQPSSQRSGHTVYNPSTSTSAKQLSGYTWNIQYADGSGAKGNVFSDKVVIGPVTATSQAVEAATSVSSTFQQDTQNDGLVGLAFSSINTVSPKKQTTFFDTVKSTLTSPLFCAYLRKGQAGSYDFGYIDSTKYTGSLRYTSVDNSQGFWMFTAGSGVGSAIADTGTTLLLLPDSIVDNYYSKVSGAYYSDDDGGYVFPCSTTPPNYSVTIAGGTSTVPGSYINYAPTDSSGTTCYGGIQSNGGEGFSIFGDIFLKSQYVVFNSNGPQLGFAQQK